jgi:DNA processing protein
MPPRQYHFPHRNRILSGLCLGVLVVEAGDRSGSLITADWALRQSRPVFALPGRVDEAEARGALRLIQDGAWMILDPEEIPEILGLPPPSGPRGPEGPGEGPPRPAAPRRGLHPGPESALGGRLADLFREEDAWHADRIIERLGVPPGEVLAELARLETEGLLYRLPGGAYALR